MVAPIKSFNTYSLWEFFDSLFLSRCFPAPVLRTTNGTVKFRWGSFLLVFCFIILWLGQHPSIDKVTSILDGHAKRKLDVCHYDLLLLLVVDVE
jgi:hypothetical protein